MPPPIVSTSAFVKTVNGRSPVSGAVVVTAGDVGLGTGDDVTFQVLHINTIGVFGTGGGAVYLNYPGGGGFPAGNYLRGDNFCGRALLGPTLPTDTGETLIVGGDARISGGELTVHDAYGGVITVGNVLSKLRLIGNGVDRVTIANTGNSPGELACGNLILFGFAGLADINTSITAGTAAGQACWDSGLGKFRGWTGSGWVDLS